MALVPGGFHGKEITRELLNRRTPSSRTYTTREGTETTFLYPEPVPFQDAMGWHLVDPTLVPSAGGGWHNSGEAAAISSSLAALATIAVPRFAATRRARFRCRSPPAATRKWE